VILLCTLVVPSAAVASLKTITLAELVRKSDVIAFGHVRSAGSPNRTNAAVLEITSAMKGKMAIGRGNLPLCNGEVDTEHPDLAYVRGDYVVFAARNKGCFRLVWGWNSLIVVLNGRAHTSGIDDQPEDLPVEQFLAEIRSLVDKPQPNRPGTAESH